MKAYRFELVGNYINGCLSAPDSCTVEVNAETIEQAESQIKNAIQSVARFSGMRIADSYEKKDEYTMFDGLISVYDIEGKGI